MRGPVVHLSRAPGAGCGSAEPVRAALLLLVAMQQPTTGQGRAPRSRATSTALGTALLLRDAGVRSRSAPRPDPDPRTGNRPLPPMAEGLIDERTRRTSARFGAARRLRWLREARMPQSPRDGCPLRLPRPIRTECSLAELGIDMTTLPAPDTSHRGRPVPRRRSVHRARSVPAAQRAARAQARCGRRQARHAEASPTRRLGADARSAAHPWGAAPSPRTRRRRLPHRRRSRPGSTA